MDGTYRAIGVAHLLGDMRMKIYQVWIIYGMNGEKKLAWEISNYLFARDYAFGLQKEGFPDWCISIISKEIDRSELIYGS